MDLHKEGQERILGKETKLVEKTASRIEELDGPATPEAPTALDVRVNVPSNGVASLPVNGRHAGPPGEDASKVEPVTMEETAPGSGGSTGEVESHQNANSDRDLRRIARAEKRQVARAEKRQRPRAPRAEKIAALGDSGTVREEELPVGLPPAGEEPMGDAASVNATDALFVNLSDEKIGRATRTARRARSKQEAAVAAMNGATDHPALGALNRHLNMMMQQLGAAHRVIGRVAAERDAFRQQLADLQGIPVESIAVMSLSQMEGRRSRAVGGIAVASPGQTEVRRSRATDSDEPSPPSVISRLNYFSVDDIAVARKRRQRFVLGLLLVVLIIGLAARLGIMQMPDRLSRESLTALPFIGDFMSILLAGYLFFRVIKVSSKGVKWVFPSEEQKRRRR